MKLDELLLQLDEKLHASIEACREQAAGKALTLSQLSYLEAIFRLGVSSVCGLADRMEVSRASASAGVHKLVRQGLVKMEPSRVDRRAFTLALTPAGARIVEAQKKALQELGARVRNALDAGEAELLERAFQKVLTRSQAIFHI